MIRIRRLYKLLVLLTMSLIVLVVYLNIQLNRNIVFQEHTYRISLLHNFLRSQYINPASLNSNGQNSQSISLFLRMSGKRMDHKTRFYCNVLKTMVLFWPPSLGKMVMVLDKESDEDHEFGAQLIQLTNQHFPNFIFEVRYEPLPVDNTVLDYPDRLKPLGYTRMLYSSFLIDLYTEDDIIAWLDNDSPFIFPVTKPTIMTDGKVRIIGSDCTMNISWVKSWARSTEKAIGFPQVADFMIYFPVYIYRDTFTHCREHILKRFNTSNFEEAFKKFHHTGTGQISPVSVVISYAWFMEKDRYDWSLKICNDLSIYNNRFPDGHKIQPHHVRNVLTQPQTAYHGSLIHARDVYAIIIPISFCLSQEAAGRKPLMCEKHKGSEIEYLFNLFKADLHPVRAGTPSPCTGNLASFCLNNLKRYLKGIGNDLKANSRRLEWDDFEKVGELTKEVQVTCPAHPV